jgi:Holliday junction resolvase
VIHASHQQLQAYQFRTKECAHGVKGGETIGLCIACKREKEERERQWKLEYEAKNRKKIIQGQARNLLRTEIDKFESFNLKKQDYLLSLSPREFEDVIAKLFRNLGYKVKQTPYSNDGGRDAVATKDDIIYSIECKRYGVDKSIGREPLQKFFAAMHTDKAAKGFFISTCRFTKTAINYAKDNNIELIDLNKLLSLMREAFPEDHESESVRVMCTECGSIVIFRISAHRQRTSCQNGHIVNSPFFNATLQELRESTKSRTFARQYKRPYNKR